MDDDFAKYLFIDEFSFSYELYERRCIVNNINCQCFKTYTKSRLHKS